MLAFGYYTVFPFIGTLPFVFTYSADTIWLWESTYEVGVIILILQIKILRPRKGKWLSESYFAYK